MRFNFFIVGTASPNIQLDSLILELDYKRVELGSLILELDYKRIKLGSPILELDYKRIELDALILQLDLAIFSIYPKNYFNDAPRVRGSSGMLPCVE